MSLLTNASFYVIETSTPTATQDFQVKASGNLCVLKGFSFSYLDRAGPTDFSTIEFRNGDTTSSSLVFTHIPTSKGGFVGYATYTAPGFIDVPRLGIRFDDGLMVRVIPSGGPDPPSMYVVGQIIYSPGMEPNS